MVHSRFLDRLLDDVLRLRHGDGRFELENLAGHRVRIPVGPGLHHPARNRLLRPELAPPPVGDLLSPGHLLAHLLLPNGESPMASIAGSRRRGQGHPGEGRQDERAAMAGGLRFGLDQ